MKGFVFTILGNILALSAMPAVAAPVDAPSRVAPAVPAAPEDLPFTPQFAATIDGYRDCLTNVIDGAGVGAPMGVANKALAACAARRDALEAQLLKDIRSENPGYSQERTRALLRQGMAFIEPAMADFALTVAEHATTGAASADAPTLSSGGNVG